MEFLLLDFGTFVAHEPKVSKLPPRETGMAVNASCGRRTSSVLSYTGWAYKAT